MSFVKAEALQRFRPTTNEMHQSSKIAIAGRLIGPLLLMVAFVGISAPADAAFGSVRCV